MEEEVKQEEYSTVNMKEIMIEIFKGHRPKDMSFEDFKMIRKQLIKDNKNYLKGRLVHASTKFLSDKTIVGNTYIKPKENEVS